jgi:hypothetical protein
MNGLEGIVAWVVSLMVNVFFPVVVWVSVLAGLIKIVRDKKVANDQAQTQILAWANAERSCLGFECVDGQSVGKSLDKDEEED